MKLGVGNYLNNTHRELKGIIKKINCSEVTTRQKCKNFIVQKHTLTKPLIVHPVIKLMTFKKCFKIPNGLTITVKKTKLL